MGQVIRWKTGFPRCAAARSSIICDGCRLGCVSDVVIDLKCGRVAALVVPVPCRLFGLLGRRDDYVIPWEQVRRVGADIILIESELDKTRCPRRKKEFF